MPLIEFLESKYYEKPYIWKVFVYSKNNKMTEFDNIMKDVEAGKVQCIKQAFRDITELGPDEVSPALFKKAGDDYKTFEHKEIKKGNDRVYILLDRINRRLIVTHHAFKKGRVTSQEDRNLTTNIADKINSEES